MLPPAKGEMKQGMTSRSLCVPKGEGFAETTGALIFHTG